MADQSHQAEAISQLATHRPQTDAEWVAWRGRRDAARTVIADQARDDADWELLLDVLGLDDAAELAAQRGLEARS